MPPTESPAEDPHQSPLDQTKHGIESLGVGHGEGPDVRPNAPSPSQTLEQRLALLEASTETEFIRRETRFIPSLINFWSHYSWFGPNRTAPRSKAALSAVLWRIFSPGAAAAAAGAGLMVAFTALQVILVREQNAKLDQQTHIMQAQTNVALLSQLSSVIGEIHEDALKMCISAEVARAHPLPAIMALEALVREGQRNRLPLCWIDVEPPFREHWILACSSSPECLKKARDSSPDFKTYEERVKETGSKGAEAAQRTLELPARLHGQVLSLANSARPYRFIDTDAAQQLAHTPSNWASSVLRDFLGDQPPQLVVRPLSPERGYLLETLLRLGYSVGRAGQQAIGDFSHAHARGLNGRDYDGRGLDLFAMSLPLADFSGASFRFASLRDLDARCGNFEKADLSNATVSGGDYSGSNFGEARLPSADQFRPAKLERIYLVGAHVEEKDFLEKIKDTPGFNVAAYEVRPLLGSSGYEIAFRPGINIDKVMGRVMCDFRAASRIGR